MMTNIARFHIMLAVLCVSSFAMAQGASYALTNSNVFNGVDDRIQENVTVFVKDGSIEHIAKSNS